MYATPARCGMAVADMLAWRLSDNGPLGPAAARALQQVLEGAAKAPACDLEQGARVQPFVGVRAVTLAQRVGVKMCIRDRPCAASST